MLTPAPSPTTLRLAAALAAVLLAITAGCNIVAPAFYLIHGPEKIPRVYELDKTRPTVIFLDDRAMRVRRAPTRERIAAEAERSLLREGAVERMIDSRATSAVVNTEPRSRLMPVSEVGRKVGAEVVIYVVPETFTLSTDGQTFAPVARLRVKVLDAVADQRLWPEDRQGYLLEVSASTRQGAPPTDEASLREAEERFAELVGLRLAQMFYTREAETVVDERDRR
jgi:hypothetical protein